MANSKREIKIPSPEELVAKAIEHGDPRSPEYQAGMLDVLRFRINGVPIPQRYTRATIATAQADAYFAGNERGHRLWRQLQDEAK